MDNSTMDKRKPLSRIVYVEKRLRCKSFFKRMILWWKNGQ